MSKNLPLLAIFMLAVFLCICSANADELPEKAIARLGDGIIYEAALSPDGSILAIGTSIGVYLHDPFTLEKIVKLTDTVVNSISFSHDSSVLAMGKMNEISLWEMKDKREIAVMETGDLFSAYSIDFSPDDGMLVSGSGEGVIRL